MKGEYDDTRKDPFKDILHATMITIPVTENIAFLKKIVYIVSLWLYRVNDKNDE
jgi:hypothetical protein